MICLIIKNDIYNSKFIIAIPHITGIINPTASRPIDFQKYYYTDIGLRNARLNYRQYDPGHIMENIVYNELIRRGYSADVGVVYDRKKNNSPKEIDFVVNCGDKKVYIQSAFRMDSDAKEQAELQSLTLTKDFFRKIVIRSDIPRSFYDDNGFFHCRFTDFLLEKVELF